MNYTKAMMVCYFAVYGVAVTSTAIKQQFPEYNSELIQTSLQYLFWILIPTTFVFMFLAAKKGIGPKYAVKNTVLACLFSFIAIGFIIWPLLVRNEIKKHKSAIAQREHQLGKPA